MSAEMNPSVWRAPALSMRWWPVFRSEGQDFGNLEHGLELSLHPDLQEFYGFCYGGGISNALATRMPGRRLLGSMLGRSLIVPVTS